MAANTTASSNDVQKTIDAVGANDLGVLKAALENLSTNVFMADNDRKLVFLNKKAKKTLQSVAQEIRKAFIITRLRVAHEEHAATVETQTAPAAL